MDPDRWGRIEALYESAVGLEPDRRSAFLSEQCAGDDALRQEVESLLFHGENAGDFLRAPAPVKPLEAGQRVGHYEIQQKLGEGGMGAVYRAYDSQLRRPVALKVLPPEFAADPERRQRLLREARAASALTHPNIVAIHEVGSDNGVDFIAMEFVEGETLDESIPPKGLPLAKALDYGAQIAAGLAKAHAAGVIHRDLKPGNVMVTREGLVKLLDFGLARRVRVEPGQATTLTVEGEIVGTPAYMSPEQAEGKPLDARSDVFSFGLVLYRMLTGRQAFSGDTTASVMAAVLREEPAPLGEKIPRDVEKIVRRCLRKDPAQRFQHIDDVKVELEELKAEPAAKSVAPAPRRPRRWMWIAGGAAAVLFLAAGLIWRLREAAPPENLKPVALTYYPGRTSSPSFSPDGNKVAFVWNGYREDNFDIYVKQIGTEVPPLRLTTHPATDSNPAWSPNDRWIAFVRPEKDSFAIMLIPPLGGPERRLTEVPATTGLAWTPDGRWLAFAGGDSPTGARSIWAVSIESGERRRLTTFVTKYAAAQYPLGDSYPAVSPDGRELAFFRQTSPWIYDVYTQRLTPDLQGEGEPTRITSREYPSVAGLAWTADGGEIVYSAHGADSSLWRVDVSGRGTPIRLSYAFPAAMTPAIARTHSRLAYIFGQTSVNFWRLDTRTGERRRLIASSFDSLLAQYSPDGRKIAFTSNRSGNYEIWTCDADGTNCVQITSFGGPMLGSPHWSPDGRWLAFDCARGQYQIYVVAADGGGKPRSLTEPAANGNTPSWSSDGRWIYFASDRSGRYEVWKAPSDGGKAVQVTHQGGGRAAVSPDGKYLYFSRVAPGISGGPLCRIPTAGGEEEQIVPRVTDFDVTAKGVYFGVPGDRAIRFRAADSGKERILTTLDPPFFPSQVIASPDDAYVLWRQVDRITRDLMLVEGFR